MRTIISVAIVLVGLQAAPTTIDLTGVVARDRIREPTTSSTSGGGVGGNGPVAQRGSLTMRILSARADLSEAERPVVFEVELKNVSDRSLEFPVDPNLADFEPDRPDVPYRYLSSSITLRPVAQQGTWSSEGVMLYGSRIVAASIEDLAPCATLRIRARAALKPTGATIALAETSLQISAVLLLQQNDVNIRNGNLHQVSKQISPEVVASNVVALSTKP